jgi:flagellar biogenesis protein FliO
MIEILARRRLSGSQELLVIQVAGRILVLASTSGGGVSVVSEITDRAQIAEMRAQTAIAPKRKAVEIN